MQNAHCEHCLGAAQTRRDFLRVGTLSFMGIGLSDFLSFHDAQALALTSSAIPAPQAKGAVCHFGLARRRNQPSR